MQSNIFFCPLPPDIDEARLIDSLPAYRREKAQKYLNKDDRLLSAAAWHLMRYAVKEACGVDAFTLNVESDALKKPFFTGYPDIHFNISHCKTAVACAVDSAPCGVDIEPLKPAGSEIIKRFAPQRLDEFNTITDLRQRDEFFIHLWTESESIYKTGKSTEGSALPQIIPKGYKVYHFKHGVYGIALCARFCPRELRVVEWGEIMECKM